MKILFIILGTLSLLLGIIGIALPLLPTTPFLLLAATLYAHASPRVYRRLVRSRLLGRYIRDYRKRRAMPPTLRIISLIIIFITLLTSVLTLRELL